MILFFIGFKLKGLGLLLALFGFMDLGVIVYVIGLYVMVCATLKVEYVSKLGIGIFFIIYGIVHVIAGYLGIMSGADVMALVLIAGIILVILGARALTSEPVQINNG